MVDSNNIKPAGTTFSVTDTQHGSSVALGGSFTVEFEGQRTGYLPYTIGAAGMKSALEGELLVLSDLTEVFSPSLSLDTNLTPTTRTCKSKVSPQSEPSM